MFSFIARLRKKSIEQRRRITLATALSITGVIVAMWVIWIASGGLSGRIGDESAARVGTPSQEILTSFKSLIRSLTQSLGDLKKL